MNWKFCSFILFICAAFVLVKSESYIEIDEDGNEYDVKRFHVQSRQLNDSKQQCVVTRRRRQYDAIEEASDSLVAQAMDSEDMKDLEKQEAEDEKDEVLEDKEDEDESKDNLVQIDSNKDHINTSVIPDKPKVEKNEQDQVKPEVPLSTGVVASAGTDMLENFDQKPGKLIKVKKEKVQKVTVLRPQPEHEIEGTDNEEQVEQTGHPILQSIQISPSALVSNTAANSFVIIEAPQPQRLVSIPGNPFLSALPTDQEYLPNEESFAYPLSYAYSQEPMTTTAIWSTGEDTPQNPFNRIKDGPVRGNDAESEINTYQLTPNEGPLVDKDEGILLTEENVEETSPVSVNKNKKKNKKNKKKTKRRPSKRRNRRPNRNRNKSKKKQSNRKPPGSYMVNRPHYNQSPNRNRNRKRNGNRSSTRPIKNHTGHQSNYSKDKKKKPKPGIMSTTFSVTETRTGEDSNIECIVIEKEPKTTTPPSSTTTTTTTRRPFWNILGRNNRNPAHARDFGNRKRANLRFVAN